MGKSLSMVKEYATIAFTLLGVLFGMMIMTFIFGQLGTSNANTFDDSSISIVNQSDNTGTVIWLNQTGYTLPTVSNANHSSSTINSIWASVNTAYPYNVTVPASNYTLTNGILRNATVSTLTNISISYTENYKSESEMTSRDVQNNSLQGVVSYTNNSTTQFNTVSIAVILILLIGVFLLFWGIFVANKKKSSSGSSGGNFGNY
jgi:hypothetical protein